MLKTRAETHVGGVLYFCPMLTKVRVCRKISVNLPNIKFHKNLFSGSQVDSCIQTDGWGGQI
jgi:hypothetical protein